MKKGMILCLVLLVSTFLVLQVCAEETLAIGAKGNSVLEMKKRLQDLRYIKDGSLTKKFTDQTQASLMEFQRLNGLHETGVLDTATRELLFSDQAVSKPYPTMRPLATLPPVEVPESTSLDREGFLSGNGELIYENEDEGCWIYISRDLRVTISRGEDSSIPLVWFETDIRTRNGQSFRTVMTDSAHPGKKFQYPYVIASREHFVLGFSDDFYAERMAHDQTVGIIIRNGVIISDKTNHHPGHHLPNLDMMAQYPDGTLMTYRCNECTAEELIEKGAVNVFSFGPVLLHEGRIMKWCIPIIAALSLDRLWA